MSTSPSVSKSPSTGTGDALRFGLAVNVGLSDGVDGDVAAGYDDLGYLTAVDSVGVDSVGVDLVGGDANALGSGGDCTGVVSGT